MLPEIESTQPLIPELALRAMPTHAELLTALMAYRHAMTGGARHVWLCVTDERGWKLTDQIREIDGAYARGTVGRGDHNLVLHDLATTLIAAIRNYLETIPCA